MAQRRSALGRGLGALLGGSPPLASGAEATPPGTAPSPPDEAASERLGHGGTPAPAQASGGAALRPIPVARIRPNPDQPRRRFDESELASLAASIREHGVLQPVVVRQAGEDFELLVGERRFRAAQAAGLAAIPAVVADVAPSERLELALVENIQRSDLNPIELALAFRALADAGATQEEIGRRVSLDRSTIANHLRLLELPRDLQEDVERGVLSQGHAKALLQVPEGAARRRLRDRIVREGLSVRATERAARELAGRRRAGPSGEQTARVLDPDLEAVLDRLRERFATAVRIRDRHGRGRIEIDYHGQEQLMHLVDLLLGDR